MRRRTGGPQAEREQEMLAIGFIDTLRVGQEQPVQGGLHARLQSEVGLHV